jgi:hypothetical protein
VVGELVGEVVGDVVVGEPVGEGIGEPVGDLVGDVVVGDEVGDVVGVDVVGELVGEVVGETVGEVMGRPVNMHKASSDDKGRAQSWPSFSWPRASSPFEQVMPTSLNSTMLVVAMAIPVSPVRVVVWTLSVVSNVVR